MALIQKRPKIRLHLPDTIVPGERFVARVEVVADKPVPTQGVSITLVGETRAVVGRGNWRETLSSRVVVLEAVPERGRSLLHGVRAHDCAFRLPDGAPPSFEGVAGAVRYRIEVRVRIPWWRDARATFVLRVRGKPALPDAGQPLRFTSALGGPRGSAAYLEGSLASDVVVPDEVLAGAIALANVEQNRYRVIKVALVGIETVTIPARMRFVGARSSRAEIARHGLEIPLPAPREGASLPFAFRVPEVTSGFASEMVRLDWYLEVRVVVRLGADLEVRTPVTVATDSPVRREHARTGVAPPAIGGDRLEAVWQLVARELGLDYEGERLAGQAGGAAVALRRETRGKDGAFLVGELHYPTLGLGLDVRPATLLSGLGGHGRFKLGHEWDSAHRASARDPAQAAAFLRPLADALRPLATEEMTDESARLSRQDGGRDVAAVRQFAQDVLALATALGEQRGLIPPPAAFASAAVLESWRRLAARLEGRLSTGAMSVDGSLAGARVRVATVWDEAVPVGTALELWPAHRLQLPDDGFSAARLPSELQVIIARLGAGLQVDASTLALSLPAPELSGDVLAERLDAMATLAARLRDGSAGAYR